MGYSIADRMIDWLTEGQELTSYDPRSKEWSWQEDELEPWEYPEIEFDTEVVEAQIDAWYAGQKEDGYISVYVSPNGKWFTSLEEAYLAVYEKDRYKAILQEAYMKGYEAGCEGFIVDDAFDRWFATKDIPKEDIR